jgi:hypothetical protein
VTEPERSLADRLGVDHERGMPHWRGAPYMRVALDALAGAGFMGFVDDDDQEDRGSGCWLLFVWIAIHDYETFGALNTTAHIASGRLFDWLDALKRAGVITHPGSGQVTAWAYTERGWLAAYLVRTTLEDFVVDRG